MLNDAGVFAHCSCGGDRRRGPPRYHRPPQRGWNGAGRWLLHHRNGRYQLHLYELRAGDVGWSTPYPDADWGVSESLDARKARLTDILEDGGISKLTYLYDFGDGWEHTIKIERVDICPTFRWHSLSRARHEPLTLGRQQRL